MMESVTPRELARLFDSTHQLLKLYHHKNKWPQIYPLLNNLAERYYLIYQACPKGLQAQLSLYVPDYGYTTNLVVNQCVLACVLCRALNYNQAISEQIIATCLANYLCVQSQSNKLACAQALTAQDKKLWQCRHQLAVKLLHASGPMTLSVQHILARLNKYKQALLSAPKTMIYDGATTLVALANIIAMNITYRQTGEHISLHKALADIYLRTPNEFAQKAIKNFIAHTGSYLPASEVNYAEQSLIYLATDDRARHILVDVSRPEKVRWHRVKATLSTFEKQRACSDNRLLYTVWFSDNINFAHPEDIAKSQRQKYLNLISQLKISKEYSFSSLNKLLSPFPELILQLTLAVKPYNKEHQRAKGLRHCLSMVGYDNAPAIIQKVLFQRLVATISHPLELHIVKRLENIAVIIQAFFKHSTIQQFEQVTLPLYAYCVFLCENHATALSRKTLFEQAESNIVSAPLACLFGVSAIDQTSLNEYLTQLLGDNPWTGYLLNSEQKEKQQLSIEEKHWIAIKLFAHYVFQPNAAFSSWQEQIMTQSLNLVGWQSKADFYSYLQTCEFADNF
ncbi:hypothetical protein LY624_18015 [Pseudoalteromonas sp. N1230-9]|uniref:hypothetical protein n=1 Tax=Pseudoalteromonas sp. N1230-9 TaxID=2907156 RepID=UPI002B3136E6|nr:hypothetical protein LY624_18015 [Pseudoalteromonas sp. N1230-9]